MTDHQHSSGAARGFSGLTALASTISAEPIIKAPQPVRAAVATVRPEDAPFVPEVPKPGFWTGSRKTWALVIASVCVIAYVNSTPTKPSYSGASYAPPPTTASRPTTPTPPVQQTPPASGFSEPMKVPTATPNQVLSQGEIKYCLAESARIDAMQSIIDNNRQAHITNFNFRVNDFNARCTNYRYRQADMNLAAREVEALTSALKAQAAEQVRAWR